MLLVNIRSLKESQMSKIIAIMPIKLNNERLPGKNTKLLGTKPLLQYELDNLLLLDDITEVDVYCSDDRIIEYLSEGVNFVKRSPELDSAKTNFSQIFRSFMEEKDADIYVYAHATAPFVTKETMKKCIDAVLKGDFDSAFCAEKIQDFLWKDGNPMNFDAQNVPRSQDLEVIYRETSGVYVFKKEVFQKYGRRIGMKPYICELGVKERIDINTFEDFAFAEAMLNVDC